MRYKTINKLNEIQLIQETLQGNRKAFEPLVQAYWSNVHSIILRYVKSSEVASDIGQETFISAFTKLGQFKQNMKFAPWLYRIAINKAIEYLRKKNKYRKVDFEIDKIPDSNTISSLVEKFSTFDECLEMLPEAYKIMFVLRHGLKLSYNEISFITDVSVGTIKGTFFRIKNIIRQAHFSKNKCEKVKESRNS